MGQAFMSLGAHHAYSLEGPPLAHLHALACMLSLYEHSVCRHATFWQVCTIGIAEQVACGPAQGSVQRNPQHDL